MCGNSAWFRTCETHLCRPYRYAVPEKEDIVSNVGLKIEYGEALDMGEDKGTFRTVSDLEHVQIISMYAGEGLGMQKIATQKGRSTRTIQVHILQHNAAVKRSSFCPVCKRANSSYFKREAKRTKTSLDGSEIANEL